jgi:hypothetical protein
VCAVNHNVCADVTLFALFDRSIFLMCSTGSGESHTAYFYKRTNSAAPCAARTGTSLLQVPAREGSQLRHSDVVCSNYFRECIEQALGPAEALAEHVETVSNKILNSGRPKRERKPRNLNL